EYVRQLRNMAGNTIFAGYVYGERLAALFRHCALFVLPSDLEGLPIVLLEALAYGAPVLASDIPPNVEVLGDHGEYFKAGNVDDLARALRACLRESEALRRNSSELREWAMVQYDWDAVCDATERVYMGVTGR
ncbi:MAG: glycosyltransferase family 4 protein, partial [Coriobacteriia bacterium]|nr:glycosyltransferase family 4 protein [Coriobacteriia bacterium]